MGRWVIGWVGGKQANNLINNSPKKNEWVGNERTVSRTPPLSRTSGKSSEDLPTLLIYVGFSVGTPPVRPFLRLLVGSSVEQRDLRCFVAKVAPGNGDRIGREFGRAVREALTESKEEGGLPWENGFVRKFAHITSHFQGAKKKKGGLCSIYEHNLLYAKVRKFY